MISTAHGLKFTGFKVGYHEGSLAEVESEYCQSTRLSATRRSDRARNHPAQAEPVSGPHIESVFQ